MTGKYKTCLWSRSWPPFFKSSYSFLCGCGLCMFLCGSLFLMSRIPEQKVESSYRPEIINRWLPEVATCIFLYNVCIFLCKCPIGEGKRTVSVETVGFDCLLLASAAPAACFLLPLACTIPLHSHCIDYFLVTPLFFCSTWLMRVFALNTVSIYQQVCASVSVSELAATLPLSMTHSRTHSHTSTKALSDS